MTRRLMVAFAVGVWLLAGCGTDDGDDDGGGDSDGAAALPTECTEPPLTMRLEALGESPAGSADFEVTDAVARRVPIVPRPDGETAGDPEELAAAQEEATTTDLALYAIYLADFEIDRDELEGFGFGEVQPEPGGTIGTVNIVPTTMDGFATGDVADGGDIEYETTTTFGSLGVTVVGEEQDGFTAFDDVDGQVEILALDDDTICVDIDVELQLSGEPVVAAEGVVTAPIVRAPDEFFYT